MAAHTYWRIDITANNGNVSTVTLAEVEMRATTGGADQCSGGTATASGTGTPANAVDNSGATVWSAGVTTGWWQYQFASAVSVAEYTVAGNATNVTRNPKNWTLQYSDNGADWTVADTRTNETGWALGEVRAYSISSGATTGVFAVAESGSDTAALAGDVHVAGALAATESGSDTAAISGAVRIIGALSATESGADSAAIAGAVRTQGALAAAETGADSAAIAGDVFVIGAIAATETGSDSASIAGDVQNPISGVMAATETGSDSASASGVVSVRGSAAITETGADTAIVVGKVFITGTLAASESGQDTAAFTGLVVAPTVSYLTATLTVRAAMGARLSSATALQGRTSTNPAIGARPRLREH